MKIDFVIFDWNDTIVDRTSTLNRMLQNKTDQKLMKKYGITVSDSDFLSSFKKTNRDMKAITSSNQKIIGGLWTKLFFKNLGVNVPDKTCESIQREFDELCLKDINLNSGVKETLDFLLQKQIPLGIITNSKKEDLVKELKKFDLSKHFGISVTGCEYGEKSTKKPFEIFLKQASEKYGRTIEPGNCVHVGNNPNEDLVAAEFGIKTVLFDKLNSLEPDTRITHKITDFSQLIKLVTQIHSD